MCLDAIVLASEDTPNQVLVIAINDALHAGICASSQEEQSNEDDRDVECQHRVAIERLLAQPIYATVNSPHSDISHTPKDESEEGVEEGGHQG